MPPRYVYWTIVIDGTPTAFRAATRDELLPTLKQIQRKTPGAEMKWFARGRVWESPEHEREATRPPPRRESIRGPHAGNRRGPGGARAFGRPPHGDGARRRAAFGFGNERRGPSERREPERVPLRRPRQHPSAPPRPHDADRPPKPGHEPPPGRPKSEDVRIVPDKPFRGHKPRRPRNG